jgi:hypothetical protein
MSHLHFCLTRSYCASLEKLPTDEAKGKANCLWRREEMQNSKAFELAAGRKTAGEHVRRRRELRSSPAAASRAGAAQRRHAAAPRRPPAPPWSRRRATLLRGPSRELAVAPPSSTAKLPRAAVDRCPDAFSRLGPGPSRAGDSASGSGRGERSTWSGGAEHDLEERRGKTGGEGLEGSCRGRGKGGDDGAAEGEREGEQWYFCICVRSVGEKVFYTSNTNTVGEANSGMPLQICIALLESVLVNNFSWCMAACGSPI